jgi:hypothetical protein
VEIIPPLQVELQIKFILNGQQLLEEAIIQLEIYIQQLQEELIMEFLEEFLQLLVEIVIL